MESISTELLSETISLAIEENKHLSCATFVTFVNEYLPSDIIEALEEINGSLTFLEDIWSEQFETEALVLDGTEESNDGTCEICERPVKLTRHHVYPRETHRQMKKKGLTSEDLMKTIAVCRMCHNSIHRFFSNDELSHRYHSLKLIMETEPMLRYAKWASKQSFTPR